MDVTEITSGNGLIYQLNGRFDAHQIPKLKSRLEPLQSPVTLDFEKVNFIDSSGLAMLVSLYKKSREAGFALKITNLQDSVRLIFEITQLYAILPIED